MATTKEDSAVSESVIFGDNGTVVGGDNRPVVGGDERPVVNGDDRPIVLEKGVKGSVVVVNRTKHYAFIKRRDKPEYRDLFVREASIVGNIRDKRFFVSDLSFYEIPDCLKTLTELEERLISPRIPFMVIRSLGYSKQFDLKGNLVNVPMNVDTNVSILPRTFSDTQTIQLKLMRQMKNKNAFMYETIRPKVVHTAVKYLVEQELYKDEGIVISNDWLNQHFSERENFIVNDEDKKINENENTKGSDDDDNWNECDDEPINPGATETLLNDEIADQNDTGIKFAPAENNRPISILMDLKVDELTFPKIYCGKQRKIKENTKLTYAKTAKNDPVTCIRYFEHRLKCLWEILSAPYSPFQGYELEDKYVRVEFQVRGSPHIHALVWLKNAPKYDKDKPESIERCTEFIDKLISVNWNISFQIHVIEHKILL
ncbi:unnamed protein product [Rotaria sp. Silwood1]|nr:unnamed protein product [Rotaria sp. Silwood1]